MQRPRHWLAAGAIIAGICISGCGLTQAEGSASAEDAPARLTPVTGSQVSGVVLTAEAARRIGLTTAPVESLATPALNGEGAALIVPASAVVYDRDGVTWVYTTSQPLTYVRQRVAIARIDGDRAILRSGPPEGTQVVTVGVDELLGSEYGVQGE
jgi:multidrug efflux pump subunit AcrA (membrane-fusion protein)